jgi:hypothetical protein
MTNSDKSSKAEDSPLYGPVCKPLSFMEWFADMSERGRDQKVWIDRLDDRELRLYGK